MGHFWTTLYIDRHPLTEASQSHIDPDSSTQESQYQTAVTSDRAKNVNWGGGTPTSRSLPLRLVSFLSYSFLLSLFDNLKTKIDNFKTVSSA